METREEKQRAFFALYKEKNPKRQEISAASVIQSMDYRMISSMPVVPRKAPAPKRTEQKGSQQNQSLYMAYNLECPNTRHSVFY
mgnify:CR=1 FL=1